ncbi:MAG: hypothetical protein WB438_04225 [Candidatus Cybelea sp.]
MCAHRRSIDGYETVTTTETIPVAVIAAPPAVTGKNRIPLRPF